MNPPPPPPPAGPAQPNPGPSILWPLAAVLVTALIAVSWLVALFTTEPAPSPAAPSPASMVRH
jgi:hypothetical protein